MSARAGAATVVAAAWLVLAVPASAPAIPIPEGPATPPSPFFGSPATTQPLSYAEAPTPPRHPFMAPNDSSNIHDDAYQSDTADRPGPLGNATERLSTFYAMDCASVAFDSHGRLETVCVGLARPVLKLLDAHTLAELATIDLPPRQSVPTNPFSDFSGGGYFFLDNQDRAVVVTNTRHLLIIGQTDGPGFAVQHDYDLTKLVPDGDKLISTLPDWTGRLWVITTQGRVVTIDPATGVMKAKATDEPIGNSFAVGEDGGVYIVTDAALYRFDALADGRPHVSWREPYANVGIVKPGQTERGSGTTPTLMGAAFVAITDNDDPMNVVVYLRGRHIDGGRRRRVCAVPVFEKGASATDNSLIGTARSMVVENNYGYSGPQSTQGGSVPGGLTRVDIDPTTYHCRVAWTNPERAPSVVPKLSLRNGLVYTYTKDPSSPLDDPWYLTTIDFRTGRTAFKALSGTGLGFNNNYAPVSLGPDGTAYVGSLGGLAAVRDASPPASEPRPAD